MTYVIITNSVNEFGSFIFSARTVTCISCMSPMFNAKLSTPDGSEISLWESLSSQYFKLPENFSRYCDPEYFDPGKLRLRTCLDTCVWLSMDNAFFGMKLLLNCLFSPT